MPVGAPRFGRRPRSPPPAPRRREARGVGPPFPRRWWSAPDPSRLEIRGPAAIASGCSAGRAGGRPCSTGHDRHVETVGRDRVDREAEAAHVEDRALRWDRHVEVGDITRRHGRGQDRRRRPAGPEHGRHRGRGAGGGAEDDDVEPGDPPGPQPRQDRRVAGPAVDLHHRGATRLPQHRSRAERGRSGARRYRSGHQGRQAGDQGHRHRAGDEQTRLADRRRRRIGGGRSGGGRRLGRSRGGRRVGGRLPGHRGDRLGGGRRRGRRPRPEAGSGGQECGCGQGEGCEVADPEVAEGPSGCGRGHAVEPGQHRPGG